MIPDLLQRKQTHFVLWRPGVTDPVPKLVIGTFQPDTPPTLDAPPPFDMKASDISPDLFEIAAADCQLVDGDTYHYWFEVTDTNVNVGTHGPLRVTDPTAFGVDWRLTFAFPAPYNPDPNNPTDAEAAAAVVLFKDGKLHPADAASVPNTFTDTADAKMSTLPANNRLVIYELPTAWTKEGDLVNAKNAGVGTFRDVLALIDRNAPGANFAGVAALGAGNQYLVDLGINALELLPPADTFLDRRSWGYATSNYYAPDFDLGRPIDPNASPAVNAATPSTAVTDLLDVTRACHRHGIRFFYDAVMAFSNEDAYRVVNFLDFHVWWTDFKNGPFDHIDPEQDGRDGFGGDLWKYAYNPQAYDPISGAIGPTYLGRRHMICHILHWMNFYHLDGLRLDSVNNYNNWDFAGEVRDNGRQAWNDRWEAEGNPAGSGNDRFLVIGEELSVPKGLLGKLDALWNEPFKQALRRVILGRSSGSFEEEVRKLIDCRNAGFSDGAQAVNYIGSHDVGGFGNERFYNYLDNNGIALKDKPIKLAFVCLLTAVGIPMILAGDEFAEQSNNAQETDANKEIDPINYQHVEQPWRKSIFDYVSSLVKFRISAPALSVNDTTFIHVDFNDGKRVLAWKRGRDGIDDPVVVVANFSDWGTNDPLNPASHYDVANWPATPPGRDWREITKSRQVAPGMAGHESLFPWEAKVYTLS
jgi:1,4-alpha-glucan branching enzyme